MNYKLIESKDNKIFKFLKSLKIKKYRDKESLFFAEGTKVIKESLAYVNPTYIAISESFNEEGLMEKISKVCKNIFVFKENLFNSLAETESSQGIVAYYKHLDKKSLSEIKKGRYLYLDELQDPGNVGGLIRSALAFNIDGVILSKNSVELYNPKLIRTTMASIFKINIYTSLDVKELEDLKKNGFTIVTTSVKDADISYNYKFSENMVLVLGNEARGVSQYIEDLSDEKIYIPMSMELDSLNVNVAGSILLYEMNHDNFR
ncbi:TrmH family RNA methyltransferase [Peptoniphilus catoniae]|uniref:TrmH family RNA methyltransferase n=1 Tax=Peptoniphilus catoniae TaxID=1660341 RepID=UPI0010FD7D49|nr:RNA methyltransferase [Peptoniphilus catoniae]